MTEKKIGNSETKTINWQNFNRRINLEEWNEIQQRVFGLHSNKEALDPSALQALYAAEALLREFVFIGLDKTLLSETEIN
jgi:hypothetical protein